MKKVERKVKRPISSGQKTAKPVAPKSKAAGEPSDNLSLSEIKNLIELISDKNFNEFELERGNFRLRLSKGLVKSSAAPAQAAVVDQVAASASIPVTAVQPQPVISAPPVAEPAPVKQEENLHIVTSPIVGTFYGAPNPNAKSFVTVGDHVESGAVLCIIEAMKLMNEIQADASGVIAKIFAEDGQPVEYGQPLFGIRK